MGEYFRDRGEDALIIYDDLSNRLLLTVRSPCCSVVRQDVNIPGRRILPPLSSAGACCACYAEYVEAFTKGEVKGKTGSLLRCRLSKLRRVTFLRSFRPTNLHYRWSDLPGNQPVQRRYCPAVNPGISVSRVGGAAQTKS